ncbi:MAG: tetratricopeptide repeat protein [Bacteroidales bacterium]|nr:tetratricopeptide repeat protein [Bacteroidales bacterium]
MATRKSLLLFFVFLSVFRLHAGEIDSLEILLPRLKGKEKVDVLNRLIQLNTRSNQDKSIQYGNEAIELANKINYQQGIASAHHYISTAYYYISNYSKALDHLLLSLNIYEAVNDSNTVAVLQNKIAINCRMLGRHEEALSYTFRTLRHAESIADSSAMANAFNNIGGIYKDLNNYQKAAEYYTRSHEISLRNNLEKILSNTYNNLGIIHRFQNNYDSAIEYYQKAIEIDLKLGNKREAAQGLNNIGKSYSFMGRHSEAIEYFESALAINIEINNRESQSVSLMNLGQAYADLAQYNLALSYLEKSYELIELTGNINRQILVMKELARVQTAAGHFQDAASNYQKLLVLNDSLNIQQKRAIISEIEAKYEFEKKAQLIENLKQENNIQELRLNESRIITYGFAMLSLAIIIIAFLLIQRSKLYASHKNALLEQKLFRTQMNPHFIFNALNAIQSFVYKNEPAEAGKYLSNFARLIRLVLTNSREEYITLDNEIRTLEYYLQLQRLRFNNRFEYNIIIDAAIHRELIMVPPMLAQPFIENSIEHGIQHLSTQGNIDIEFKIIDKWIYFNIQDNGIGINQSKLNSQEQFIKHDSLALTITEERLKLLNKNNPQKIELKIIETLNENSEAKGTSITFNIPYRTINDKHPTI